ncbi:MAG TPA: Ig-like domain-containing protein [Candidatus Dormibacteraeota bacterium]|nr:Ig-like domain-containing protein [Candidatus Dormibacteraeota bacterium]
MTQGTHRIRFVLGAAVAVLGFGMATAQSAFAQDGPGSAANASAGHHQYSGNNGEQDVTVCSDLVSPGSAFCHAHKRTDAAATSKRPAPNGTVSPNVVGNNGAYDPAFLRSAYNLSSSGGTGLTVAVVDAYDDPNAEADLAQYRSHFGLPACTTASGCFKKVNQNGGTTPPAADYGWAQEISLDLDMVSAICPNCKILLVEASSNSLTDLGTAVNRAVTMGAMAVSNSYGGTEYSGETVDSATYYNHPGVAITVSSGDSGYGVQFPAASHYVTSVGGTTLNQATHTGTRNATETAWSGAGSGCSGYESKPSWQTDGGCGRRTVSDVSAVADPNTGVWVYDTYGDPGFEVFGGTSVAAPIVAGVYALAGTPGSSDTPASYPYGHAASLNDITSGSNGSCGGTYLCTAVAGYDGPTGLGTPNTLTAFAGGPPGPPPPTPGSLSLSAAQTLTAGQPSTAMTVTATPAPTSTLSVGLSSSSSKGSFATSSTGPWSSTLTVSVGSGGSGTFYYQDTAAGSPTLTASGTGYTSGTRTESVKAGALSKITVSPSSTSVRVGRTVTFSAKGSDAYGNAVSLSSVAWSVSPSTLGTFSTSTPGKFTGRRTGSGTVTAKVGTVSGTAAVTVR